MYGAAMGTLLSQLVVSLGAPMLWKETRPFVKLYVGSWKYVRHLKDALTFLDK